MSFPPSKPFNPVVSRVPNLGPSSGDPKAQRDPNSLASLGSKLQAMTDQAAADRLYDAPMPTSKEGFSSGPHPYGLLDLLTVVLGGIGLAMIIASGSR